MVTLLEAVDEGRLAGLKALRDTLAQEIDLGTHGEKECTQLASLARQLRETLREIETLEPSAPQTGSVVNDLTARRDARRAAPAGADATGTDD